jgi:M6 family metalloprotease-like protein
MGASTRSFVSSLVAIATLGILALPSPGAAQPCASGTDVRNLNDSAVPQSLKNQILGNPGQIISKANTAQYPSGKLVVIRAALQDAAINPAVTPAYINEIFYGSVAGEKNIKGYYASNSYAQFSVTAGSTPDWFTLNKKITDYSNGIEGNPTFLQDVLKKANVNWSALDANHDGTINIPEAQIIILVPNALPGSGFASTRVVNAGSVATPTGTFTFNNRRVIIFSLKSFLDPQYNINPIRSLPTVAHELGHAFFNLPDRYGANTGTGEYDMMGSAGSNKWVHFPMHDKIKIGWIAPKIIRQHGGQCLQFLASELQAVALVVVPIDQFLATPLEYWVVENRDRLGDGGGYDDDLPGHGLAVWYTSVGTFFGFDDVRLVDFSKPDQAGTSYNNPGSNALFTLNPADPQRLLFTRDGQWNLLWFQNVSDVNDNFSGLFMFAEF